MSQLNPNAAEFVPVSPTRSIPSPVCRALIDDEVIAQSPKRPGRVDINVPSETEFEFEVKSRPSEVENGHNSETSNSTPERVDHLLNGKSLEEIPEFHPASTPAKLPTDEFHFGPNSAPFAPRTLLDQSETALSTQAEYGDDTRHTLNTSINDSELTEQNHETDDPMSMSFYAEKGDSNPFQEDKDDNDLNKIHKLPDNLEEFLKDTIDANKENFSFNDTISDLPEHNPLGIPLDNDRALIQTTDLDKISQDDEKELESPLENRELMDTHPDNNLVTLEPQQINLNVPSTEESNAIIDIDIHGVTPLAFIQTTQESDQAATLLADLKIETQDSLPSQQNNESNILPKPEPSVPESSEINEFIRNEQSLASEDLCSFNPFQSKNQPQFETISIDASPLCQYPVADSTSDTNAFSPGGLQESELLQEQKMEDDITCSIKDDISSPIEQSSNASAFDDFARESATVNTTENCNEVPIEVNAQEILADLASDVPSPIVNIEQNAFEPRVTNDAIIPGAGVTVNGFDNSVEVFNEQISIKTENIAPEFAESAILTPSEEGRVNEDLSVSSPIVNQTECLIEQILEHQPEITQPVEPVASQIQPEAAALPTITLVHSTPEVKTKDKKDIKAPLLGKKPIGKVEPRKTTSPKVGVAKPSSKPSNIASKTGVPSRDPIKSGISKTAAPIPAKTTSNVKSPRVPSVPKTGSTATASKTIETKISSTTANLKAAPRVPISKRPIYESIATRTTTRPATAAAAAKPSPTKPTTTRPATAPRTLAPKPASNSATTKPLTGAKPRVPLASRTTSTAAPTTVKSTLAAASKTLAATKPASPKTSSVVSPKPRTIASAAPPKPRVPSTKTVTKSADFDKEKKDSANKLTASRSAVSRTITSTAARTTSSTVTKTEIKSLSNRTVAARTTTTTRTTTLGKQPVSKTKTTKIEKPKENGVAPTNITEEINEINVVNNIVNQSETETLLKDNSPVNNRLLLDNPLVDPNPE
ncbi:hypothetical protein ABEB36_008523 [Hypothenemus hampei]|uniref:Ataxin-2 C-terminal domain-containing protein n=1 Tax=Hypothenemus hampei TaxID=57062 RepID=A0ABD1EMS1_HYPHA